MRHFQFLNGSSLWGREVNTQLKCSVMRTITTWCFGNYGNTEVHFIQPGVRWEGAASGDVDQSVLVWELLIMVPVRKQKWCWLCRSKQRKMFDLKYKFRSCQHRGICRGRWGVSSREIHLIHLPIQLPKQRVQRAFSFLTLCIFILSISFHVIWII